MLLPTSIERDVPEWFFQRTGAELKAAFLAAVQRREREQVSSGGWLCTLCRLRKAPSLSEKKGWGREAAAGPRVTPQACGGLYRG